MVLKGARCEKENGEREKSWRWHATDLAITALIREQVVV